MNARSIGLSIGVFSCVLALSLAPSAYATAELQLSNGTASVDILDGDPGDTCGVADCVTYNGPVGAWTVNVTTGQSKDLSAPVLLDLQSLDTHSSSDGSTLTILFSDNGFTPAFPNFTFDVGGKLSTLGTITFSLFGGGSNTKFDTAPSNQIGSTLTFHTTGTFTGSTQGLSGGSADPYSLTERITLTFGNAQGKATQLAADVTAVPEPISILLMGTVLLLVVGAIRRKAQPQ